MTSSGPARGLRARWQLRLDPPLRRYVATIVHILGERHDAKLLDIAAGTGWLRQLEFGSYHALDITGDHERWDINTPLPDRHAGAYDIAVCLGALHFALDPRAALEQFGRALRPDGELVVGAPWLFPPHDREIDLWRLSPRLFWRLLDERFASVDIYPIGTVLGIPGQILNRYVTGPFHGLDAATLQRASRMRKGPRWSAEVPEDIPLRWLGPVGMIAHARNRR